MRRLLPTLFTALLTFLLAVPSAFAGANSLFTLGLSTGVSAASSEFELAAPNMNAALGARVRVFRVLALDVQMQADQNSERQLVEGPETNSLYRWTALLYPISSDHFGLYMGAGFGSRDFNDVTDVMGTSTRYRFGGGMEVVAGRHVAFTIEAYYTVPGYGMVRAYDQARIAAEGSDTLDAKELTDWFDETGGPQDGYEAFAGLRFYF